MIAILDYGLGNIRAFSNVYKKLNIDHLLAKSEADLDKASKIIFPGVGSFDFAMASLERSGLKESLSHLVLEKKVPILGICVGMQLMADTSDEGTCQGLGWISGKVRKLEAIAQSVMEYPLPHMGWNSLQIGQPRDAIFDGLDDESRFYFLHSYCFECADDKHSIAKSSYGMTFSAAIRRDNIYGIQCHPEKSHSAGLRVLKNFAGLA